MISKQRRRHSKHVKFALPLQQLGCYLRFLYPPAGAGARYKTGLKWIPQKTAILFATTVAVRTFQLG